VINMKHDIIDERVCYEYLHSIVTTFYENCKDFIDKERVLRKEPRVFIELEQYAMKWAVAESVAKQKRPAWGIRWRGAN
jgi:hypothetical protein